jgi:hypothetical protein
MARKTCGHARLALPPDRRRVSIAKVTRREADHPATHPSFTRSGGRNMTAVKPIPEGYRAVTPYLIVADAAGAMTPAQKA